MYAIFPRLRPVIIVVLLFAEIGICEGAIRERLRYVGLRRHFVQSNQDAQVKRCICKPARFAQDRLSSFRAVSE